MSKILCYSLFVGSHARLAAASFGCVGTLEAEELFSLIHGQDEDNFGFSLTAAL